MAYLIFKCLHLVSMVAWFAGLFYLIRLFVYHTEAFDMKENASAVLVQQYHLMEDRLFRIIVRPAMGMTWVFGLLLIHNRGLDWLQASSWLHVKLLLVFLLSGYTERNKGVIKKLAVGERVMSAYRFRLYNEVPTIFLLAIILLAVFKNLVNFGYVLLAIIGFAILLMVMTKWYKNIRKYKSEKK